jgi:integrase
MAGKWQTSRTPGVLKQEDPRGKARYKAVYRDARGVATSRTFPTLRMAKDFLADARIRRATNTLPAVSKGSRTVTQLWDHFVKTFEGKPSTFASYEHRWTNYIRPALGDRRLDSLRKSGIKEFYTDLEERTTRDTRRKVQQIVHKILAVAVEDEWIVKNPADGIKTPQAITKREPRPLTDSEVEKLADEVPPRYRALVWVLAETGARPGEITALKVKNLNGHIRIAEATVEVSGRKITSIPKTEASVRNVPITTRLRAILKDHFEGIDHRERPWVNRFDLESYVFSSEAGKQISQSNFRNRVLVPAAERVGITGFTTYDLRHTAISLWLMRGLSPWEVAKTVGHTDLKMIEQRYGHLYLDPLQEKMDRLLEANGIQ